MRTLIFIGFLFLTGCGKKAVAPPDFYWDSMEVTASAYNSVVSQTSDNPFITAFGDSLKPGLKYIAVSRDLLKKGLKHNTPVIIEGFKDVYLVKDKMHWRWRNRIDIYMGNDIEAAKQWGRKKVCIDFRVPDDYDFAKHRP